MKHRILLIISLFIMSIAAHAQDNSEAIRPVTSVLQLQIGSVSARDTYLTPQLYSGINWGVQYERWHAWKVPHWGSQQSVSIHFGMPKDQGNHSEEWIGRMRYRYAAHYCWEQLGWSSLSLMVGPFVGGSVGFDYNVKMSSSNNPATAKVAINTGVSAAAIWHYSLRKQLCSAMFQMQVPMMGYTIQPEYGASYYESFYLESAGNKHHFTSFHNRQDIELRLTTDLALSSIPFLQNNGNRLRLGVGYIRETMDINSVVTRYSSFDFVVGVVFQHLKYNKKMSNHLKSPIYEAY